MAKSKHRNWMIKVEGKQRIFSPSGNAYDVLEYEKYSYTEGHIEAVCNLIRDNLTEELLTPSFKQDYPDEHKRWNNHLFGYCVPATFSLLYLMDTDNLEAFTSKDNEGVEHWWIQDTNSSKIYDITHEQYTDKSVLKEIYNTGKVSGYYGGYKPNYENPAKRFLTLMHKVQPSAIRWTTEDKEESTPGTLHNFL